MDIQVKKPFAESCEENKNDILPKLREWFADRSSVLEIGSGTGQHAVYFAEQMPYLQWHTSDRDENHVGIHQWLTEANLPNTHLPLSLNVKEQPWPSVEVDAVFSANTVHIMHWPEVELMFAGIGQLLPTQGLFALYGPFNYHGEFTSDSNARFDVWLKNRDPESGVRDFEALNALAEQAGMQLQEDAEMPCNNRLLCWRKG